MLLERLSPGSACGLPAVRSKRDADYDEIAKAIGKSERGAAGNW